MHAWTDAGQDGLGEFVIGSRFCPLALPCAARSPAFKPVVYNPPLTASARLCSPSCSRSPQASLHNPFGSAPLEHYSSIE